MSERVLAVIVTYNPKVDALRVLLQAATSQLEAIIIIDNGSNNAQDIQALVEEFKADSSCVINVKFELKNLGLGAAHNIGINIAKHDQFNYVLLLDQDSVPMQDMVGKLLQAHIEKSKTTLVSATGVNYINADNGSESFFVRFGWLKFVRQYCADRDSDGCIEADFLISSGSLISLQDIQVIGEMDESLFIDHVDTEWFLRAHSKGYKAFGVCDAIMQHGLGETTHQINLGGHYILRKIFGLKNARQRNVPQHNPFRYYYIFRNSVLLYRRDYTSLQWKWNDLQRLCMILFMFGLLKSPRRLNLKMMLKGLRDGIRGISGKASFG